MLSADRASQFIARIELADFGLFIGTVVIVALLVRGIRGISGWLSTKFPSKRMVVFGWVPLLNFLLYFGGVCGAFYFIFEPRREFLIAFIVSIFVAFGYAAKDFLASLIGGIILLIDKPFQVGDRVTFQNNYGEIITIGLRSVKMLTLDESVVTIPNSRFMSDVVSSSSAGELGMMVTVDVYVPSRVDLYIVKDILEKETKKSEYVDLKSKIVIVGKEILGIDGAVSFAMTVKCILKDARREKAFQTDLLMAANRELNQRNLKI